MKNNLLGRTIDNSLSKRPRRNHAPAFKAKVALEALKGDQTLVELSQRYQANLKTIFYGASLIKR